MLTKKYIVLIFPSLPLASVHEKFRGIDKSI